MHLLERKTSMVTLYYSPGACSLAVHGVLKWIGAPYEAIKVDQSAPEYRRLNPAGAVPASRLNDGSVLTQADAILHYLARRHPEADLLDDRTLETAADLDRWGCFLTGDLHPAFVPVFVPRRFTTATDEAALKAVAEAGLALVAERVALLKDHLTGRDWMIGNKCTILDAYALPMLNWAQGKLPRGLNPYVAVRAHHQRLLADPVVERIMAMEQVQS